MSSWTIHYCFEHIDPSRLTAGRELRKMTKTALAELIGKTASAVSQFESGKLSMDISTFQEIVTVLSLPPLFFTHSAATRASDFDASQCHFRAKRNVPQVERLQSRRYAEQIIAIYNALEELGVQFPSPSVPNFVLAQEFLNENVIENMADAVRRHWGLNSGPIPDMAALLESAGIRIIFLPPDSSNIDGFSVWVSGVPYIMVVGDSAPSRLQFDYAHELAHVILHQDFPPGSLETERAANRFAGAFLMPSISFAKEGPKAWGGLKALLSVKKRWYVSMSAALFRARQIGIMRESAYRWAMIQLSESGQRIDEREEFAKPQPTLLEQGLKLVAQDTTLDELAEMTRVGVDMLEYSLIVQGVTQDTIASLRPRAPLKRATVIRFPRLEK